MKKPFLAAALLWAVCGGFVAEALAQPNPNQLINYRKGAMSLQGKYFSPVYAMAAGRTPMDPRIAQRNADYLAVLTQLAWDDVPANSLGLPNTRAKEEIGSDGAKFKARADGLMADIQKLQAATKTGEAVALKAAIQGVANSCNGCHEAFSSFNFRYAPLP